MTPTGTCGTVLAAPRELGGRLGDHAPRLAQLLDARHERKHDAQRPVPRRAQQRAQLRPEQLRPRQAQAQAAQPLPAAALLVGDPAAGERRIAPTASAS